MQDLNCGAFHISDLAARDPVAAAELRRACVEQEARAEPLSAFEEAIRPRPDDWAGAGAAAPGQAWSYEPAPWSPDGGDIMLAAAGVLVLGGLVAAAVFAERIAGGVRARLAGQTLAWRPWLASAAIALAAAMLAGWVHLDGVFGYGTVMARRKSLLDLAVLTVLVRCALAFLPRRG